jgi:uncharacterized protein DUF3551
MRLSILIVTLTVAAPVGLGAGSAAAQFFEGQSVIFGRHTGPQAPWCSHQDAGGNVEEDCSFNSFEECRQLAMGANNTFCTPNPRYDVSIQPVRRKKGDRVRR